MMTTVSNNTGTPVGRAATPWCVSELLCFVTDNCNVLPVDDLVEICVDFYSESEIINARSAVECGCGLYGSAIRGTGYQTDYDYNDGRHR